MKASSGGSRLAATALGIIFLTAVFAVNSINNSRHEDYRNSNFAKFWIAGHMILVGENPYNPLQWSAEHRRLGSGWTPDVIFLYPLPQAFLMVPLALLPPAASFIVWGVLSQAIVAGACYALLVRSGSAEQKLMFVPLVLFLLFFGPVYLTLQIGSIGALTVAIVLAGIFLLDRDQGFFAGLILSLLMLKPPLGIPILLLAGVWFLLRHDARALLGTFAGGMILLVSGLLYDPNWVGEFAANSQVVSGRTLGTQSSLWSFSDFVCSQNGICTLALGGVLSLVLLALAAWWIRRFRQGNSAWEAFNIILPVSFACAVYVFVYDQILYVIPIIWICLQLIKGTRSYLPAFLCLIFLDLMSLQLLVLQATTQKDTWSILTTIVVLAMCLGLLEFDRHRRLQGAPSA
jgi:hypothetical protein